jgi:hypothetical protein
MSALRTKLTTLCYDPEGMCYAKNRQNSLSSLSEDEDPICLLDYTAS